MKIFKKFIYMCAILLFCLTLFTAKTILADVATSDNFTVLVGHEGWVSADYTKTDQENRAEYTRNFHVEVNPDLVEDLTLDENNLPQFEWVHEMCFVVNGVASEQCEIDTMSDFEYAAGEIRKITPNTSFSMAFYTSKSKLPYYYQNNEDDIQITFKNKFNCLQNCDGYVQNQILSEISLQLEETPPKLDANQSILYDNNTHVGEEVELKLFFVDNESGIDESKFKYVWTVGNDSITFENINIPFNNGDTIKYRPPIISFNEKIQATIWILTYDKAGNGNFVKNIDIFSNFVNYTLLDARTYYFDSQETNLVYEQTSNLPVNGLYDNEVNLNVEVSNPNLDVNRIYYLWSENLTANIIDINNLYVNNDNLKYVPKAKELSYDKDIIQKYYFYILAYDLDDNYFFDFREYDIKIDKRILLIDETSNLPISDDYFGDEQFSFVLETGSEVLPSTLKYIWSYSDSILISKVTSNYIDQINNPFEQNISAYLFIIGYDDEENLYQITRKYKFDFTAPIITFLTEIDETIPYQNLTIEIEFQDAHSGIDENRIYYLWIQGSIDNITSINIPYTVGGAVSPTNLQGLWRVYFIGYDKVDNYLSGYLEYTFDNIPPQVILQSSGLDNTRVSNNHSIYLKIEDNIADTFPCDWILKGEEISDHNNLGMVCRNNQHSNAPKEIEGDYYFWFYLIDQAGNEVLQKSEKSYLIDSKRPLIDYEISSSHLNYSALNSIKIVFSDSSLINEGSLKYGWFKESENVLSSIKLKNNFINDSTIEYPLNYYGVYRLWLYAEDMIGNEFFKSLDEVFYIDTAIINLFLNGNETINLIKGEEYIELGAVAYKGDNSIDGKPMDVVISGEVNVNKKGVYEVSYTSGNGVNKVTTIRTVVVKESNYYLVIIFLVFVIGVFGYLFQITMNKKRRIDKDFDNI